MRYEDFEVRIARGRGGGYQAEVLHSLYGGAASRFKLPFSHRQLLDLPETFERRARGARLEERSRSGSFSGADYFNPPPEEIGEALFRALFSGEVGQRFRESLSHLDGRRSGEGLRVRLTFDLADPALTPLAALPWELMRDGERGEFLGRVRRTPILRFVQVSRPPLLPLIGPLRILILRSSPDDLDRLNLDAEWRRIWSALTSSPAIEVSSVEHPTLAGLRQIMLEETWNVIHFMGHGGFDRMGGEGCLYFEDQTGRRDRVTGSMFGEHLKSFPDLRLVFLNACWTGAMSRRRGQDPFSGVAPALLRAGVPAVLAMQFPIADAAAITFSANFYARIAAGDPVDAAVVEGRLAILRQGSYDWATPVLFARVADGDILASNSSPTIAKVARTTPRHRHAGPLRLGIRSFSDTGGAIPWGQEMENECERILDLRPYFKGSNGRHIRDPKQWRMRVLPALRSFLAGTITERRALHLNLATHGSIAFAAGFFLDVRSGLDVTIRQRGRMGVLEWRALTGAPLIGARLHAEQDVPRDLRSPDVALALAITRPVLEDAKLYLSRHRVAIRRIRPVALVPEPSPTGVRDGLHALQIAQAIASKLRERTLRERQGTIHLFVAAPNALLFFLGQLSHGLGRIQLYEYDFDTMRPGAYRPSIRLPPQETRPQPL